MTLYTFMVYYMTLTLRTIRYLVRWLMNRIHI